MQLLKKLIQKLNKKELKFIMEGEPRYQSGYDQWYGIRRFFDWLNSNLYKMHVRVFLSKFRSYTECPACKGARLKPESLNWKWQGHTLPELYQKSVDDLLQLIEGIAPVMSPDPKQFSFSGSGNPGLRFTRIRFLRPGQKETPQVNLIPCG